MIEPLTGCLLLQHRLTTSESEWSKRVAYVHSDLTELRDADGTHDVVTLSGVFHELPKDVVPLVLYPKSTLCH